MKSLALSTTEKQLSNFNFEQLASLKDTAKANIAGATSAADVTTEICTIWAKVRPYIIWAENIPSIGKFVTILADLLDSICKG